jgi:hypothetical protein
MRLANNKLTSCVAANDTILNWGMHTSEAEDLQHSDHVPPVVVGWDRWIVTYKPKDEVGGLSVA